LLSKQTRIYLSRSNKCVNSKISLGSFDRSKAVVVMIVVWVVNIIRLVQPTDAPFGAIVPTMKRNLVLFGILYMQHVSIDSIIYEQDTLVSTKHYMLKFISILHVTIQIVLVWNWSKWKKVSDCFNEMMMKSPLY